MKKNIEDYIFHKENFLSKKYCENTIDELSMCDWRKHEWYSPKTQSKSGKLGDKEPDILMIFDCDEKIIKINDFIIDNLHAIILEYIENYKFDWFDNWTGYSEIRFNRYFPNQTMKTHWDQIHSIFDGERKGVPTLSIVGILNDDYEGGELIMFEDKKIETKKGDILIFPSNFLYPHEVTPVTKGVRYSYVSWVW